MVYVLFSEAYVIFVLRASFFGWSAGGARKEYPELLL